MLVNNYLSKRYIFFFWIQTPTNITILKNKVVSIVLDFHTHCHYYWLLIEKPPQSNDSYLSNDECLIQVTLKREECKHENPLFFYIAQSFGDRDELSQNSAQNLSWLNQTWTMTNEVGNILFNLQLDDVL